MSTIVFETDKATFNVSLDDTLMLLRFCITQTRVKEASRVLRTIKSQTSQEVEVSSLYFGYVVMELLKKGKGQVFCRKCGQIYPANNLKHFLIDLGPHPFQINFQPEWGSSRKRFKKRNRIPGILGGQGFECPNSHELISMITCMI
jgi:hypothetical protein